MTTPLSDERIAELTYRLKGPVTSPLDWWCEADDLFMIGRDLLAEVERLRAENARLAKLEPLAKAAFDYLNAEAQSDYAHDQDDMGRACYWSERQEAAMEAMQNAVDDLDVEDTDGDATE